MSLLHTQTVANVPIQLSFPPPRLKPLFTPLSVTNVKYQKR